MTAALSPRIVEEPGNGTLEIFPPRISCRWHSTYPSANSTIVAAIKPVAWGQVSGTLCIAGSGVPGGVLTFSKRRPITCETVESLRGHFLIRKPSADV